MKAFEFSAKIVDNYIKIPARLEPEINLSKDNEVRVIIMIDEVVSDDDNSFEIMAREQFLNGYASSDSVYDQYLLGSAEGVILC